MTKYSAPRFCQFENAYKEGLLKAVQTRPDLYVLAPGQSAEEYAETTSDKMLFQIAKSGIKSVNAKSEGFKNTCKALGIKFTYDAMDAYLLGESK